MVHGWSTEVFYYMFSRCVRFMIGHTPVHRVKPAGDLERGEGVKWPPPASRRLLLQSLSREPAVMAPAASGFIKQLSAVAARDNWRLHSGCLCEMCFGNVLGNRGRFCGEHLHQVCPRHVLSDRGRFGREHL